jgi:hypothetical protein
MPPSPFCFSYYSGLALSFLSGAPASDLYLPTYAFFTAGTAGTLVEMESHTNILPELALKCDPPDLCLSSSWSYRYELLPPA